MTEMVKFPRYAIVIRITTENVSPLISWWDLRLVGCVEPVAYFLYKCLSERAINKRVVDRVFFSTEAASIVGFIIPYLNSTFLSQQFYE